MDKKLEIIGGRVGCEIALSAVADAELVSDRRTFVFPELDALAERRRPGEDVEAAVKRLAGAEVNQAAAQASIAGLHMERDKLREARAAKVLEFDTLRRAVEGWCEACNGHERALRCGDRGAIKPAVAAYNAAHALLFQLVGRQDEGAALTEEGARGCDHKRALAEVDADCAALREQNQVLLEDWSKVAGDLTGLKNEITPLLELLASLKEGYESPRFTLLRVMADRTDTRRFIDDLAKTIGVEDANDYRAMRNKVAELVQQQQRTPAEDRVIAEALRRRAQGDGTYPAGSAFVEVLLSDGTRACYWRKDLADAEVNRLKYEALAARSKLEIALHESSRWEMQAQDFRDRCVQAERDLEEMRIRERDARDESASDRRRANHAETAREEMRDQLAQARKDLEAARSLEPQLAEARAWLDKLAEAVFSTRFYCSIEPEKAINEIVGREFFRRKITLLEGEIEILKKEVQDNQARCAASERQRVGEAARHHANTVELIKICDILGPSWSAVTGGVASGLRELLESKNAELRLRSQQHEQQIATLGARLSETKASPTLAGERELLSALCAAWGAQELRVDVVRTSASVMATGAPKRETVTVLYEGAVSILDARTVAVPRG